MMNENLQTKLKNLIDSSPMSLYQILIVAICFILNMNDGIDVLVVSFTGSEIVKELGLSDTALGGIFSAGVAGMTLGCLFLAPLGDTFGRRKIFIFALIFITSGMFGVYLSHSYGLILTCRFITGLGIGGILPTMATAASEFSNNKTRDFNVGLIQGGWPLGAILTGFFCAWAVPQFGWRFAFLVAGFVSLAMLFAVIAVMPDSLAFLAKKQTLSASAHSDINNLLKKMKYAPISATEFENSNDKLSVLNTPNLTWKDLFTPEYRASTIRLWIGIFFGFLTLYTVMSWIPKIAKNAGMPFEMATCAGTALNLGAFLGVIAMGLSVTRLGVRKTLLGFMLIACSIMLAYAHLSLTFTIMFVLIFFIGFFVQGGFNAFFPTATRIYPSAMRSTGVGLAMGIGRFGAILGPFIYGYLSDAGLSIPTLFTLFSLPLLVAGFMAYTIPSKNLDIESNESKNNNFH
jgi:MFS transporter, AAHS family, 4-hydroxybenzoate transporter